MLYALLCYGSEDEVASWSSEQEQVVMSRCAAAADLIRDFVTRGPALRLMPTTTAVTLRSGAQPVVLDGPFAETGEQLLGLWLLNCPSLDEAVAAARLLVEARGLHEGALEIRPVALYEDADDHRPPSQLKPAMRLMT